MKSRGKFIWFVILFTIGLSILLYPLTSNLWNQYRADQLISAYTRTAVTSDQDSIKQEIDEAAAYNKTLIGTVVPDAFSIHEGKTDAVYESLLNPESDGMMGYVEVPAIHVKLPIYHDTTDVTLAKGAGHLPGSSLPVGGESTHTVISAHRGLPSAKMFTNLDKINKGDVFYFYVLNETLAYEVDQIETVEPTEVKDLGIVQGEDLATLVTCTPYAVNTQRLLVRGHRIDYKKAVGIASRKGTAKTSTQDPSVWSFIVCMVIGLAIALVMFYFAERKHKQKNEKQKKENC